MARAETDGIRAIDRAFDIVETLNTLEGAGVSELARAVDLPKSTVHNHLATLERAGYVVNDAGEYRVGLKFLKLGENARRYHELYRVATDQVDRLAEKTGEISGLMIEEHGEGVFLYRSRGSEAAHIDTAVGDRVPLHCTALGKAVLAFLPADRRDRIIERHGLAAMTENTITDRDELAAELERVRENRVAFDDAERLDGLRGVAAPILSGTDEVIGSISVAGPTHRMHEGRFREEFPETVLGAANVVELNIQYS